MADELRVDSGALIFATLADVYISSGMIDEAISILQDGLARNPNYHLAKIILSRAYCLKGEHDKAIDVLEPIYDVVKDDEAANLCLALSYHRRGDRARAAKFCETVLRINPENAEAQKLFQEIMPEPAPPEPEPEAPLMMPEEPVLARPMEKTVAAEPPSPVPPEEAVPAEPEPEPPAVVPEEPVLARPMETTVAVESPPPVPPKEAVPVEKTVPPPAPLQEEIFEADIPLRELADLDIHELPEEAPGAEVVPLAALDRPAKRLLDLASVKGVFISTKDGLLIKNYSKGENDVEAMCASVAAICLDVDESFRMLKRGGLTRCIIEKPDETICVMAVGDSLLTVTTKVEAKPGLVFVYAHKIIEEIEEILR